MEYRWLGKSGLKVSALSLGTMGFGGAVNGGWVGTIELDDAKRQVAMALDAGVNLFDTASSYSQGLSEQMLGDALGAQRDRVLVSTKVHGRVGDGVNDVGQSRWHLMRTVERSLRRLHSDHIDILHMHGFDACTPLEETLSTLDSLVKRGLVRYIACSNYAAWQIMKAIGLSDRHGWERYAATQSYYSLVSRDLEFEILPLCRDQGVGVLVWSPLAGGYLSGRLGARRAAIGSLGVGPIDEVKGEQIIEHMRAIASAHDASVAQVALNWLRAKPDVSSIIIGARTTEQLADNLAAAQWQLAGDEVALLDDLSAVTPPYPQWYQAQFTAERSSRRGAGTGAFDYRFPTEG